MILHFVSELVFGQKFLPVVLGLQNAAQLANAVAVDAQHQVTEHLVLAGHHIFGRQLSVRLAPMHRGRIEGDLPELSGLDFGQNRIIDQLVELVGVRDDFL